MQYVLVHRLTAMTYNNVCRLGAEEVWVWVWKREIFRFGSGKEKWNVHDGIQMEVYTLAYGTATRTRRRDLIEPLRRMLR